MSIDRYTKNDEGFRKYVELMETTPTKKRQKFLDSAKLENPHFVEIVEKHIITFERILKLPEMELAEVFGADGLKPEVIANAICSVPDLDLREKLKRFIPKKLATQVLLQIKDSPEPKPEHIGASRLHFIQAARELEKLGRLKTIQIPHYGDDYFRGKKAA